MSQDSKGSQSNKTSETPNMTDAPFKSTLDFVQNDHDGAIHDAEAQKIDQDTKLAPPIQQAAKSSMDRAAHYGWDVRDDDPMKLTQHKRENLTREQLKLDHPKENEKKIRKFYSKQNDLIDQFLQSGDEERLAAIDAAENGPRIKFAINASSTVNLCLFAIQLYAAISTRSLSLFATAADAFMDLVSSIVMLVTSHLASRPSIYKYPVGRTRIETIGIILFCALMTTVAVQLIIESGRALGSGTRSEESLKIAPLVCVGIALFSKTTLMIYCFFLRQYPTCRVFFLDHRNDIVVNSFGLVMSIVGTRVVWWVDPLGAICIGVLILVSWVTNAFEQVWLLVGKGAPREFLSKVIYMAVTHDTHILKVDTCRAYHAGEKYYVEVDIIMDQDTPLKTSHDVSQTLQRKIEGLETVERCFVHVDYEGDHDPHEEHKPLYDKERKSKTLRDHIIDTKNKVVDMIPSPKKIRSPTTPSQETK